MAKIVRCVNCGTKNGAVFDFCYWCEENMYVVAPVKLTVWGKIKAALKEWW